MLDHDLTVALLCRLNQNQSALGMAWRSWRSGRSAMKAAKPTMSS
ncbi:hypothetical protein P4110_04970 [Pseudomonas aeruginosa]|nr:hypothetical protein [Pseudomonas aeruginosa]